MFTILFVLAYMALVIGYYVSLRMIIARIRARSDATWRALGQPDEQFFGVGAVAFRVYVHVGGDFKQLRDPTLTTLIWVARLLLVACLASLGFLFWLWLWTNGSFHVE